MGLQFTMVIENYPLAMEKIATGWGPPVISGVINHYNPH
jgi:hypothetical protein